MSNSIDERIVQMRFNESNFAKGIKSTLDALSDLKKGLDMKGAKASFGDLSSIANGIKLDNVAAEVQNLGSRFEGLKAVALGAFAAIGAKAIDLGLTMGRNMVGNLTQAARDGFGEYELKMGSIQTMLANTQKYGTTLTEVTAALDELNTYADKTIYNFGDMTRNIGLFTNAGLRVEEATSMIKGFSNVAAASGTNAQGAAGAAYQLSQALSAGTIRLMDWRSLTNVGMGNKNMQEGIIAIADAMGMFNRNTTSAEAASKDFNGSLEANWLSADVMSNYLKIMAGDMDAATMASLGLTEAQVAMFQQQAATAQEAATKVRTLSQLIGTFAERAGSSWAQTWEIVFGDFHEATELFTEIDGILGAFQEASGNARNEQLQIWSDLGGRVAIIDGLRNAFNALMQIVNPITQAFREVFPPSWGTTLAKISFLFRDLTAALIISDQASQNIKMVFTALFRVIKFGMDVIGGILKVFGTLVRVAFQLVGGILGLITPLFTFVRNLIPVQAAAEGVSFSVSDLFNALVAFIDFITGPVIGGLGKARDAFDEWLNGGTAMQQLQDLQIVLLKTIMTVAMFWNVLTQGDFTGGGFFDESSRVVDVLFRIRGAILAVIDWFKNLGRVAGDVAGNIGNNFKNTGDFFGSIGNALKDFANMMPDVLKDIGSGIMDLMSNINMEQILAVVNVGVMVAIGTMIKKFLDGLKTAVDFKDNFLQGILDGLDGLNGVLGAMQTQLKADALLKIAIAIGVLAASLVILATIDPERLVSAVAGMATAFGILMAALVIVSKIGTTWSGALKLPILMAALIQLATALTLVSIAVRNMAGLSWDELIRGMTGVAVAMGLLVGAAVIMSRFTKNITSASIGMILMAVAINAIAAAVAIFGNMEMGTLVQGGIAVATTLALLTGAAVILSKFAPQMVLSAVGLMAMAAAINMLIVPLTAFGLMPLEVLTQGMIILAILIAGLVVAANAMSTAGPQMALGAVGMMAMAAAINMLLVPIAVLGAMDLGTMIQGLIGLGIVMLALVVAANAMTGAIVGAGAMIVMAGAVLILSVALSVLSAIPTEALVIALVALAAAFIIIGAATLVLGPVAPMMFLVALGFAAFAVAALILAGAALLFVGALGLLGPALLVATGGLMAFAEVAPKIAEAVPAFLGIGAGLLVFGAGAAVAGAGILILGVGLAALGAGLALVGMFGPIGTIALTAFVLALGKLAGEMPNMLAMSGVFVTLGAAVLVLGAGMVVLGAGGLLVAVALALLVPLGALISASFALITAAINKLLPQTEKVGQLSANFDKLGSAAKKVGSSMASASGGLIAMAAAFVIVGTGATSANGQILALGVATTVAMNMMRGATQQTSAGFQQFSAAVLVAMNSLRAGVVAGSQDVARAAAGMGHAVSSAAGAVRGQQGNMYAAGQSVGSAISDGMARGIYNGQGYVASAARSVAQAALASSKRTLGIASPSKEYFKMGEFNNEGMANGMLRRMSVVTRASEIVGGAAIHAMQDTLRDVKNKVGGEFDMQPTIRPVLDLSDFAKKAKSIDTLLDTPTLSLPATIASAAALSSELYSDTSDSDDPQDPTSGSGGDTYNYTQNIHTNKAPSRAELYRDGKNLISQEKGSRTYSATKS